MTADLHPSTHLRAAAWVPNDDPQRQWDEAIALAATFAAQFVPRLVKLEIIGPQFTDVHHAFDINVIKLYENSERRHTRNRAGKMLAQFVANKVALQPGFDVA